MYCMRNSLTEALSGTHVQPPTAAYMLWSLRDRKGFLFMCCGPFHVALST